mmetsp:Transcript_11162/g.27311  ORF Transcript_11162/g.27311 Transcript_11162/m.27311 type:complete len:269 (+) Transcript_11162:355-1161(+)
MKSSSNFTGSTWALKSMAAFFGSSDERICIHVFLSQFLWPKTSESCIGRPRWTSASSWRVFSLNTSFPLVRTVMSMMGSGTPLIFRSLFSTATTGSLVSQSGPPEEDEDGSAACATASPGAPLPGFRFHAFTPLMRIWYRFAPGRRSRIGTQTLSSSLAPFSHRRHLVEVCALRQQSGLFRQNQPPQDSHWLLFFSPGWEAEERVSWRILRRFMLVAVFFGTVVPLCCPLVKVAPQQWQNLLITGPLLCFLPGLRIHASQTHLDWSEA